MINGLDLFSGIGGLTVALAPWVRPFAYCENDRYAQSVLLNRMYLGDLPCGPIWDDVRTLRRETLPMVPDIVYGGFPCQDISVAGHGRGLAGERSGMYWELFRLVKELQPLFVFLENVAAIRTRGARSVVRSFASIGYDTNWDVVSAQEIGSPFIGDRWFCLAAADSKTLREQSRWRNGKGWQTQTFDSPACHARVTPWTSERGFESRIFGTGNGIPSSVDRDRALGNAVVPLQARTAFERLMGLK